MLHFEPSLVLFTVLVQLSAGLAFLIWASGLKRFPKTERFAWVIVLLSGIVGFVGAMLHLSNIMAAPYALTQVGNAWLSREIWGVSIFGLLVLLRVFGILKQSANPALAMVGIVLVLIIAQVYRVAIVPFWNTMGTEIGFLGTSFALGGVTLALIISRDKEAQGDFARNWVVWSSIAGAFASCALIVFGLHNMLTTIAPEKVTELVPWLVKMGMVHTAAVATGCAILLASKSLKNATVPVLIAFIFILFGEVVGRMLFYAANVRVGI